MQEYFKIDGVDIGHENRQFESQISVCSGKLRFNLISKEFTITPEEHGHLFAGKASKIENLRLGLSTAVGKDLYVPGEKYNTQIATPKNYGDNGDLYIHHSDYHRFHGVIDVQDGFLKLSGKVHPHYDEDPVIPIEILKCFKAAELLPLREQYTLAQARNLAPEDVYCLNIVKGIFAKFPEEILTFKNLEEISFSTFEANDIEQWPSALCELEQLHTIKWGGRSSLKKLPENIGNLKNLEVLKIAGSIEALPDSMRNLSKLRELDLIGNELSTMPSFISDLPRINALWIKGNPFTSLPANLSQLCDLSVDNKHLKLFEKRIYLSKNPSAIDDSLFDFENRVCLAKTLDKVIADTPDAKDYKDFFLKYCRPSISACAQLNNRIDIGASKFGGAPDLPEGVFYPVDENGRHYVFHAQINLEDIADFQDYLPKTGLLSFFVVTEEDSEPVPSIFYCEDLTSLSSYSYPDNVAFTDDSYTLRNNYALTFIETISVPDLCYYEINEHGEHRFPELKSRYGVYSDTTYDEFEPIEQAGQKMSESVRELFKESTPEYNFETGTFPNAVSLNDLPFTQGELSNELAAARKKGDPNDWFNLLSIKSFNVEDVSIWDAQTLTYCVHKKDLAILDFSNAFASIK